MAGLQDTHAHTYQCGVIHTCTHTHPCGVTYTCTHIPSGVTHTPMWCLTHTHTLTHSHTHSCVSHAHTHTPMWCLTHTHTHTHTLTLTHSLMCVTRTHTHVVSHAHTHTHTCGVTCTHTHTHVVSTHTHTHTHPCGVTCTHTHHSGFCTGCTERHRQAVEAIQSVLRGCRESTVCTNHHDTSAGSKGRGNLLSVLIRTPWLVRLQRIYRTKGTRMMISLPKQVQRWSTQNRHLPNLQRSPCVLFNLM